MRERLIDNPNSPQALHHHGPYHIAVPGLPALLISPMPLSFHAAKTTCPYRLPIAASPHAGEIVDAIRGILGAGAFLTFEYRQVFAGRSVGRVHA